MLNVALYAPLASQDEYTPVKRSILQTLKAWAVRTKDRLSWRLGNLAISDMYYWQDHEYTNRGDIAIRLSVEHLLAAYSSEELNFRCISWGKLDNEAVEAINQWADVFIITGGGYLFIDAAGKLNNRLSDLPSLNAITCPKVAYGIGLNSVLTEGAIDIGALPNDTTEKLRQFCNTMSLISVRDKNTQTVLSQMDVAPVECIGDPALLLPSQTQHIVHTAQQRPKIGLNLSLHGPKSNVIYQQLLPQLIPALKAFQKATNCEYYYISHCDTEHIAFEQLHLKGVKCTWIKTSPSQMVDVYQRMDMAIASMLHACILATNAGTPCFNMAYDIKNISFYHFLALPELCVMYNQLNQENFTKHLFEAWNNKEQLAKSTGQQKERWKKLNQDFVKQIDHLAKLAS